MTLSEKLTQIQVQVKLVFHSDCSFTFLSCSVPFEKVLPGYMIDMEIFW